MCRRYEDQAVAKRFLPLLSSSILLYHVVIDTGTAPSNYKEPATTIIYLSTHLSIIIQGSQDQNDDST